MKTKLLALALTAALTTGCSSIVSDSSYPVNIKSAPAGATFTVTGERGIEVASGVTPHTVSLKAGSGFFNGETYTIEFNKAGYATKKITLESGVDGWYFGNILFGGLIGLLLIDPATGAMFTLPTNANGVMAKGDANDKSLTIRDVNELSFEERQRLMRL